MKVARTVRGGGKDRGVILPESHLSLYNFKNIVDLMFDKLEKRDPNHFAVRQYKKFRLAASKTLKSILVSRGARLTPFDIGEIRDVISCKGCK